MGDGSGAKRINLSINKSNNNNASPLKITYTRYSYIDITNDFTLIKINL